jgi:hypothetical protein
MKKLLLIMLISASAMVMSSCGGGKKAAKEAFGKIENVAQLGTVEYTITKLVVADDKAFYKIGARKVIFSCKATLKAGIDMKNFSAEDAKIDGKEISINLPEPTILAMNMPVEDIKCEYMKVSGLRHDFTAEDRNALLKQGEESILGDVENYGIIDSAKENATMFFESLLKQAGFEKVTINFIKPQDKEA